MLSGRAMAAFLIKSSASVVTWTDKLEVTPSFETQMNHTKEKVKYNTILLS
jgi:hypothetical protein